MFVSPRPNRLVQTNTITNLPTEIIFLIKGELDLAGALSLADTCRGFKPLVSEKDCNKACRDAGLSLSGARSTFYGRTQATPRAMAKLLCRPRVGTQNWSKQSGGLRNIRYDFSKIVLFQDAMMSHMRVDLHPTFVSTPALHLLRKSTPHSTYNLEIRPGPEMAGVLLRKHRLYMHEYATCPPLTEMRLTLIDDESDDPPDDNDTIFSGLLSYRIRNPTGVTLWNYWTALFMFLNLPPISNSNAADCLEPEEVSQCSTNLDILAVWCDRLIDPLWIYASAPLLAGPLVSKIYMRENASMREILDDDWGIGLKGIRLEDDGSNELFPSHAVSTSVKIELKVESMWWEEMAPIISF